MKVYVLLGFCVCEGYEVISIHSDINGAKTSEDKCKNKCSLYEYYEINSYEVEPPKDEWKNTID